MNLAKVSWIFGSSVLLILGLMHLYLTFFTDEFYPKDSSLKSIMETNSPNLTDRLTFWSGWQGFNASHSIGVIFIGLINLYLISHYFKILALDHSFFVINILTVSVYIFLASKYWFNVPLFGLMLTLLCFITSYVLTITNQ